MSGKYNVYIICKDEEKFNKRKDELMKYKQMICHIQWIPAVFLTLTQCNKAMLKRLNTRYNTKQKSIIRKLGCIAAHRSALLAIFSNQTNNNIILEEDAALINPLPKPPEQSCYMGGWIIPPQITKAEKVAVDVKPKKGLNEINYDKFKVIMAHALFLKTHLEATSILNMTIEPEKLKPYDIFISDERYLNHYYFPPCFVQESHISDIDDKGADVNYYRTFDYGINYKQGKNKKKPKKGGGKQRYATKRRMGNNAQKNMYQQIQRECEKECKEYKKGSIEKKMCLDTCEKKLKYRYGVKSKNAGERSRKCKSLLKKHNLSIKTYKNGRKDLNYNKTFAEKYNKLMNEDPVKGTQFLNEIKIACDID